MTFTSLAVPPPPAQLLCGDALRPAQEQLASDFSHMASELLCASDSELQARLKGYDNHDRLTFGRARTHLLDREALGPKQLSPDKFQSVRPLDHSAFVSQLSASRHPGVWATLRESLEVLCQDLPPGDQVIVSIYCHRVLIRPGDSYRGFFHRDNKPGEKCGTCVSYPRVDADKLRGGSLVCRWFDSDDGPIPAKQRMVLPPSVYHGSRLLMRYPHNLAHGVTRGRHRLPAHPDRKISVRDFLTPAENDFLKDLMIVTISEAPNAED